MTAPDPRATLCAYLVAMRAEIIETMARDGFSAGLGALLAQLAATLAALDNPLRDGVALRPFGDPQSAGSGGREQPTGEAETANRAPSPLAAIGDAAAGYDPQADSLGSWNEAVEALRCRHLRAVVTDDGEAIRLTLYGPGGAIGAVRIDPARAVGLAGELCAAARRRMMRSMLCSQNCTQGG